MKRRHLIKWLGFFSLSWAIAPRHLAAQFQPPPSGDDFARTAAALADLMFPGDGLPGAGQLGLHHRILSTPELRALMTKGVDWLESRAALQGAAGFLALDENGKLAALDAAFASHEEGIQQFVLTLRLRLGEAYYREPAIKAAFAYTGPPQPDGFADFQERPA